MVIILFAIAVAVWAGLQSYSALEVTLIFLGVLALMAYLANTGRSLWPKGKKEEKDEKALGQQYRDWLLAAGFAVENLPEDDENHFGFAATRQGRPVNIVMTKAGGRVVTFGLKFSTGNAATKKLVARMDADLLDAAAKELQLEMVRYGVGYQNLQPPFENVLLVITAVVDQSLDEYRFFEKVRYMSNASILYTILLERGLNLALGSLGQDDEADKVDKADEEA